MPGGRPRTHEITQLFESTSFGRESELCTFIEDNIESFTYNLLGSDYIGHTREAMLFKQFSPGSQRGSRADFLIETETGPIVVEVKNPKQKHHELSRAISQLLTQGSCHKQLYGVMPRMILVSSAYHEIVHTVISDFALPIEVVYLSRDNAGVCNG